MPDKFDIRGDEIFFGGYSVAFISPMLPATVRDRVQTALLDWEHDGASIERKCNDAYEEGARSRDNEIEELESKISDMEIEISVLEEECRK